MLHCAIDWPSCLFVIHFCPQCGTQISYRIPEGDSLPRAVCYACEHIHYENPRLIVGCVAQHEGNILLCRRAIEPQLGLWTLPAGFMENGESTAEGAVRETLEEAGAVASELYAFAMVSVPHINQVHLFYRATLKQPEHSAGAESLEVLLVSPKDIPWHQLAFKSVRFCLERYLSDVETGCFSFHEIILDQHYRYQSSREN